jgi:uncharacterized membrane protein (UPF0127 family)
LLTRLIRLSAALVLLLTGACALDAAEVKPLSIASGDRSFAFDVEVATSQADRSRGLMYRRTLADDGGMLFDFGEEQFVTMWMRNTYVSLDMLFIDEDGTIGHIASETTPLSDTIIPSRVDARFVLEIKGGTSRRLGIAPGDTVSGPAIDDLR